MSSPEKVTAIEARLQTVTDPKEKVDLLNALAEELGTSEPRRALEIGQQAVQIAREQSYDKGLAITLLRISRCYFTFADYGQTIANAEQALELYEQLGDVKGQAECASTIGASYLRQSIYPKAFDLLMSSVSLARKAQNVSIEASSLNILGNIYIEYGDYGTALDYYFKCYHLLEQSHAPIRSNLINNIGVVYDRMMDRRNALKYFLQAVDLARQEENKLLEALCLKNVGEILGDLKEYDNALDHLEKSLAIARQGGFERVEEVALTVIGMTYLSMQQYDRSMQAFGEGLAIARKIGDKYSEQRVIRNIGQVNSDQGKHAEALGFLHQSLSLAEEQKTIPEQAACHESLAKAYEKTGVVPAALEHYRRFHELDKQLFNEGSDKKRQMMMVQFQVERAEKDAEIYRLKNVDLAEANRLITEAKEEIEAKNKQITDSIRYAQRIQTAVMPPEAELRSALPEHFVLFRPKDIVSGDFYWYSRRGGRLLVAVVDCTGHGVPGAFMSMIGTMLLNQIVNERGIESPGRILEELHLAVRRSLNQGSGGADANDGMDACLCLCQPGQAVFAGAKRPLYHAGPSGLAVVAGSRAAIGGIQKEGRRTFPETEIPVQEGDMLYLTTDGYVDQPDGEGKRFGSKRLEEVLRSVWSLGVSEQQLGLARALDDHQGAAEQRDDIAVMGLRL